MIFLIGQVYSNFGGSFFMIGRTEAYTAYFTEFMV